MPTFRKGFNHNDITLVSDNIFNIKKGFDDKKLNEFLVKNNYLLCIKPHPGELSKISFEETENIKLISEEQMLEEKISINEMINAFDLLITDYSSIGTEFIFMDKPVLFNFSDIDEYMKNRGLYFSSDTFWFPGPKFNTFDELIDEMQKLLLDSNYFKTERDEKKKLWYGTLQDGGCKQICDFLFYNNQINLKVKKEFIHLMILLVWL